MTVHQSVSKPFVPGTTGWRADDLDDPEIERHWMHGRYEIVEGVLATMPPAYFDGSAALVSLIALLQAHFTAQKIEGRFAVEVDLVLSRSRVAVVDAAFLTRSEMKRQEKARSKNPRAGVRYGRLLVAPSLILESISKGHEDHDREVKRRWYAEAGVANYWILDGYQKTLQCLALAGTMYREDQSGRGNDTVRPSVYPGLTIALSSLWI